MKSKDLIWALIIILITGFIVFPSTRQQFELWTQNSPYLMGFIKTAILATLGERLVVRLKTGNYFSDQGFLLKAILWGFFGMLFVLIFKVYATGIASAQASNIWPDFNSKLFTAFSISLVMNLTFAPSFMLLHRVTDTYIKLTEGQLKNFKKTSIKQVVQHIDFNQFFGFVIIKTIPFFWIPAHTITFLLPENYRVLMAAYLSIALGILLSLTSKRKELNHETK